MKIHLTPGQARHHFPIIFDQAVTRRENGLSYSIEDATSFDENLFVVSGCSTFQDIPFPVNVEFRGHHAEVTEIVNAESLPKRIVATGLSINNAGMSNVRFGWDASVIDAIVCSSLELVEPKTFPRYVETGDVAIACLEEDRTEWGHLDFGVSKIVLTSDELVRHMPFLDALANLPDANVTGLTIKVGKLELDQWIESPSIKQHWNAYDIRGFERFNRVVKRYKNLRAPKRQLKEVPPEPPTDMIVDVELA